MKLIKYLSVIILLISAINPTLLFGTTTSKHWKTINTIYFNNISKENLKGDIKSAYKYYTVTFAGFHTETFGITIGTDDDIRYTNDGGKSWTKISSDRLTGHRYGLEIVNENIAWNSGNGGTRISIDGGKSWETVNSLIDPGLSYYPYMSFLDEKTGWAASPLRLQKTIDGGDTWIEMELPKNIKNIASISLRTINEGYILDTSGNIFITSNGGQSWEIRSLKLKKNEQLVITTTPMAAMRFLDPLHGLVVFDLPDGTVWSMTTVDGGKNWERVEILELRKKSVYYYKLYLSHNGQLLTAVNDFRDKHICIILSYQEP